MFSCEQSNKLPVGSFFSPLSISLDCSPDGHVKKKSFPSYPPKLEFGRITLTLR